MDLLIWKSVFHSYLLISYSEILFHVSQFQIVKFMFVVFFTFSEGKYDQFCL